MTTAAVDLYADSALTTPLTSLSIAQNVDGSTGDVDKIVYFGTPNTGVTIKAVSDPGVDNIVVSLADTAPGSGVNVTDVTLALSSGALDTNTPGASLSLGATVAGGVANAVPIYVRVADSVLAEAVYTDASLNVVPVFES